MFRLRLIDNWRQAHTFSSIWFLAIAAAAQGVLIATPAAVLQYAPQWLLQTLAFVAIAGAFVGRLTTTEKPHDPSQPH